MTRTTDEIDIDNLTPIIPVHPSAENPFDIIASPWGHIERWRASTLATGTMGALAQVYDMVRNDAAEVEARANEVEVRKSLVQHLCDQIAEMQQRINTFADALEARRRADEEREEQARRFDEEPLALPPGDPPSELEPVIAADVPDEHPGGELHELPPTAGESELPEPPLEIEDSGALPEELAKYVQVEDPPEPRGSVFPQPISVQLNEG